MVRSGLRFLGTTVVIVLITFVLLEGSLRLYHYLNPVFVFSDNSEYRFRGKPFAANYDFNLNSRGFKDVEFAKERGPNTRRIAGIGDSFVFGVVPYRYNFLTLLEENLNAKGLDTHYEVLNMGIPQTSAREYVSVLINEALPLRPDLVLIFLFVGNDFQEISRRPALQRSFVVAFIKFLYETRRHLEGNVVYDPLSGYDDDAPTFTAEKFLQLEAGRSEIYIKSNTMFRERFPLVMNYLSESKEVCSRSGIDLVIVVIPDEVQINAQLQEQVVNILSVDKDKVDFALPNTMLTQELRKRGIGYIDLLEPFKTTAKEKRLYKLQDTHWNVMGNRLAAALLEDFLHQKWQMKHSDSTMGMARSEAGWAREIRPGTTPK